MFWDGTGTPPFSLPRQSDLRQFSSSAGIQALTLLQQPEQRLDGLPGLEAGQVISENVGIRTNSARAPRAAGCSVNTVRWCWSGSSRPGRSWGTWRWRRGLGGGESDSRRYPELSPTSLQSPQGFSATDRGEAGPPAGVRATLPRQRIVFGTAHSVHAFTATDGFSVERSIDTARCSEILRWEP